jgi:hypothetical protein
MPSRSVLELRDQRQKRFAASLRLPVWAERAGARAAMMHAAARALYAALRGVDCDRLG